MSRDVSSIVATAEAHAKANLEKGCRELRSWSSNGILCQGVIRDTVEILNPIMNNEVAALSLARRLYETLAIDKVAGQ